MDCRGLEVSGASRNRCLDSAETRSRASAPVTCLPVAGFGCTPQEPTVFEPVRFFDYSYDPGGRGIIAWHWDFGDGSSSVEPRPTHRFGVDGDYDVSLTAQTPDGRGGSSERVIRVRTHEVRIVSVEAPARCGTGERVGIRIEL